MTYLTDKDIRMNGVNPELINPATFNVTLKTIRRMKSEWRHFIMFPDYPAQMEYWHSLGKPDVKNIDHRHHFFEDEIRLKPSEQHLLLPNEYALFSTEEFVSFPNGQIGIIFIRSGDARGGMDQFNTFIDPGFGYPEPNILVLEIINHAPWPRYIYRGQQAAQIFTMTGPESLVPYQGSYQGQAGAEPPR